RKKTFFIQRKDMSEEEILLSDINDFGTVLPIGIEQFARDLENVDPLSITSDKSLVLVGLEEMTIPENNLPITADEVFNLLLNGEVHCNVIAGPVIASSKSSYIVLRDGHRLIDDKAKNYVIIGDLGNGKTTLIRGLCAEFLQKGKRCFWLKDETYDAQ